MPRALGVIARVRRAQCVVAPRDRSRGRALAEVLACNLAYEELAAIRFGFAPIKSLPVEQRGVNFLRRCLDDECAGQLRDRCSSRLERPMVIVVGSDTVGGERVDRDIGHIGGPEFLFESTTYSPSRAD
jgi:hypothetical protein